MLAGSGFLGKGEAAEKAWAEGVIDPATYGGGQAYMWFFQWAFCTAGCSIVSGGVAERVKFPAWILYAFCMTTFIYPVVVCSTWGYGWLETFKKDSKGNPVGGYIDFAGSGVVHLCGGIAALVGAKVIGVRTGRFDPEKADEFTPHSAPLIVLGTFILWFGWCGFNSGSTLGMSDSGTAMVAAHVMMNTTLSAATGGMTVFLLIFAITKKYDCAALCNGILAGLVSVTAPCSNVESGSAVLIGLLGGFIFVGSAALIKKLKIDDPVDAFSVHGACGIWGCLAAALFDFGAGTEKHHGWGGFSATSYEVDGEGKYMTTGDALGANLAEIAFVIVWSGGLSLVIFAALKVAKVLRIDESTENEGMDTECASPKAYNITAPIATA
jgi:Amt family ammonium transporter